MMNPFFESVINKENNTFADYPGYQMHPPTVGQRTMSYHGGAQFGPPNITDPLGRNLEP